LSIPKKDNGLIARRQSQEEGIYRGASVLSASSFCPPELYERHVPECLNTYIRAVSRLAARGEVGTQEGSRYLFPRLSTKIRVTAMDSARSSRCSRELLDSDPEYRDENSCEIDSGGLSRCAIGHHLRIPPLVTSSAVPSIVKDPHSDVPKHTVNNNTGPKYVHKTIGLLAILH
jgi:hypothetical protein